MPTLTTLSLFAGAALLLLVVPGPAVLYIVARSASQGRRAGLVSVAGIHAGTLVHVLAAVLGLSAIVVASATAFTTLKLAGALYLVVLGVRTLLRARAGGTEAPAVEHRPLSQVFRDGLVLNILNPKTAVFFLAFVPQFVDPNAGNATSQLLVLSALFIGLGLFTDGAFALAGTFVGDRIANSPRVQRRKEIFAGSTYVGLGLITAASAGGAKTG
jgi:threonine/homoserine/homoserine lactone efflux protein